MSREEIKADLHEQEKDAYAGIPEATATPKDPIYDETKDFYIESELLRYRETHPDASSAILSSHVKATKVLVERDPEVARDLQTKLDKLDGVLDDMTESQEAALNYVASVKMADYKEAHPDALPEELVGVGKLAKMELLTAPDASAQLARAEADYTAFLTNAQKLGLVDEDGDLTEEFDNTISRTSDKFTDKEYGAQPVQDDVKHDVKMETSEAEPLFAPYQRKVQHRINEDRYFEFDVPMAQYGSAELKTVVNADGTSVESAKLDGQKHGAEIERDKNGNITSFKVYDHGTELDLAKYGDRISLSEEVKDGIRRTSVTLDGKPFGTEILTELESGKTKAAFYDSDGKPIDASAGAKIAQVKETHTEEHNQHRAGIQVCYSYEHSDELDGMDNVNAIRKAMEQQQTAQQVKSSPVMAMNVSGGAEK